MMFDNSEYALYSILHELQQKSATASKDIDIPVILGSVTDKQRVEQLLQIMSPDTVFHAAAYKHVPLVGEYV